MARDPFPFAGDTLVNVGGAVKSLDDSGRIGGPLVVFDHEDLSRYRDVFSAETDYGRALKSGLDLTYNHSLPTVSLGQDEQPNALADRVLSDVEIKVKPDEAMVWMEGQLALRDKYEQMVYTAIKAGKMGLSSGADPTRVRRAKLANGAHKVLAWPMVHASITPIPASPLTSVGAIKTLTEWAAETKCCGPYGYGEDGKPDPARMAAQAVVDRLTSILSMAVYQQLRGEMSDADRSAAIAAAFDAHRDLVLRAVEALLAADAAEALAEAKTLWVGAHRAALSQLRLSDHVEAVRDAADALTGRLTSLAALKSAEGHAIPAGRLAEIATFADALTALVAAAQPRPDPRRVDHLLAQFQVTKARYGLS
jgi:hypothetical protein